MTKKAIVTITILTIFTLLFIEKCSLINLSTADIFRPKSYKNFKGLLDTVQSKNYEIVLIDGDFPILYDSIKNEFYLSNKNGLTKIDANGNILFKANLSAEKYTTVFDFENFTPYVFTDRGVYDFTGDNLKYIPFSKIENLKNEISNFDFKNIFENYYRTAEVVIYDGDRNIDIERDCYPMYFKINNEWILLFSQKGDRRFTNDTIGQRNFESFPPKFSNNRLIVLKDFNNAVYSTKQISEKISDEYLATYIGQILKEQKLDYNSSNSIKMVSHKKDSYYFTGSYFDLPDWVSPSSICTAYFELNYNNEKLFFKEKALKYYSDYKSKNDLYLYELPQSMRNKSKLAFLDYDLDIGGHMDSLGNVIPEIKNAGIYLIRPKEKKNFR